MDEDQNADEEDEALRVQEDSTRQGSQCCQDQNSKGVVKQPSNFGAELRKHVVGDQNPQAESESLRQLRALLI